MSTLLPFSFWPVCGRDASRVSPVPPVLLIVVPESRIYFFSFVFYLLKDEQLWFSGNGNMIKFGIVTCRL